MNDCVSPQYVLGLTCGIKLSTKRALDLEHFGRVIQKGKWSGPPDSEISGCLIRKRKCGHITRILNSDTSMCIVLHATGVDGMYRSNFVPEIATNNTTLSSLVGLQ